MKTPLNFQVSEFDCGTVSAINVINYLFAREEIPAQLLRSIYRYTLDRISPTGKAGEGGTSTQAMTLLANWFNEYAAANQFPLHCQTYYRQEITPELLQKKIKKDRVALVRLYLQNQHYVLLTRMDANYVYLFDPYYLDETYADCDKQVTIIFDKLFAYNRQVALERFFSHGKKDFAMGPESQRELIICQRKAKAGN